MLCAGQQCRTQQQQKGVENRHCEIHMGNIQCGCVTLGL
jgi:hypothetical protein